jgi:hypothetical protein
LVQSKRKGTSVWSVQRNGLKSFPRVVGPHEQARGHRYLKKKRRKRVVKTEAIISLLI